MIIAIREESEKEIVYSAVRDENGKPQKFKTLSSAEDTIKPMLENSTGSTSFLLLKS